MPEPIARVTPNRSKTGQPRLDRIVDEMIEADLAMSQSIVERQPIYKGRLLEVELDVAETRNGDRLTRTVNDILDLNRIETRTMRLNKVRIPWARLVKRNSTT